jgi:8-oxo-dGTP diphosphatase
VIEVAAAVIERADGSFLLAQRPAGKVYAGYWEFPGGKIEAGESPPEALARELHEELGIEVARAFPWITRVYTYPHGTVRLHFFRITSFRSEPHPREGQAIAWQRLDAPMVTPMLPANAPVLAALALPLEYAVTNASQAGVPAMLASIDRRLESGLRMIQVREPDDARSLADQVIARAHRHGAKVLTKQPHAGADGIHFTAAQLMALRERPGSGLAAASCHTREELDRAMQLGLDFVVLGPVKDKAAIGWRRFAELAEGASLPVYAIGGLTLADLDEARRAGAHGLAMIRGAWSGADASQRLTKL